MRCQLLSKSFAKELNNDDDGWSTERWFGVRYRDVPIDDALLQQWRYDSKAAVDAIVVSGELHLPPRNSFIATDFAM